IYSVRTGDALIPSEELRLDLGEKRDSDLSQRFALRDAASDWLEINGVCGVSLPVAETHGGQRTISLSVNGRIEQGPIKPEISDPLFNQLIAMAWLKGLQ